MNTKELVEPAHRILVIDDNPRIHEDIRKILCPAAAIHDLASDAAAIFGEAPVATELSNFEMDSALQGREGLALVERALAEQRPYSLAFVDVRMPPGWDGIETIQHLWRCHPELQVVICTAYSDHSWDEIIRKLGKTDNLLILKKPFDNVEVLQLAHALTKKWVITCQVQFRMENLESVVGRRTQELVRANEQLRAEVSRRAKMEMELRELEERFHKSFETALVAMALLKADTLAHTEVNSCYLSLIRHARDQVIGKTPQELGLPGNAADFDNVITTLRTGTTICNHETTLLRADGESRQILMSIVPINLGNTACFLAVIIDITDQRLLESQLRQSQKMEAIGQLAAGVAHDFNNLLTIIIGHASIQLAKAGLDQEVGKSFEQVKLAGERASSLTRQLLTFSRKQVMNRTCLDIVETVKNMDKMLTRLVSEVIDFTVCSNEGVPCILADQSSIEQVLLNLVVNARDAMPQGGKLCVNLESRVLPAAGAKRHNEARDGRFVVLTVKDSGRGMDAETKSRIFEPFFTTKPITKGTGLGLSTVHGIVKLHEGWIEVESEIGAGSTFRVFFPATEEKPRSREATQWTKTPQATDKCILVVEDESQVRSYVCEVLRNQGYRVFDADCGRTAIDMWENVGKQVDLLLTDMVMPNGISGSTLAKVLLKRKENLKVIYMSGYSAEITHNLDLFDGRDDFLAKPFNAGKLIDAIDFAITTSA